ncbi:MAG: 16S rRNA (guanine(527)-N(7))-methyltransferase RsmG [Terriglobia bacterium]
MHDEKWLCNLLEPYGLSLGSIETSQLLTYLGLLTRWNPHVNLVSTASPEVWVRRHFAESLYLSRVITLEGPLIDIGSGAGFPALPLKIVFPDLSITLLEPVGKKRAFLKEVIRVCNLKGVEVRSERLEDYDPGPRSFSVATSRAVGHFGELVQQVSSFLEDQGRIFVWVSAKQRTELEAVSKWVTWDKPIDIPRTDNSQIWCGKRKALPRVAGDPV